MNGSSDAMNTVKTEKIEVKHENDSTMQTKTAKGGGKGDWDTTVIISEDEDADAGAKQGQVAQVWAGSMSKSSLLDSQADSD